MKTIINHIKSDWYKYLLELIVITAGVLGAFVLNNWHDNRKEGQLEHQFLERISDDLVKDIEDLQKAVELAKDRTERIEFLMVAVNDSQLFQLRPHFFVTSIEYAGYTYKPSIANHTFEEIKSSGRLSSFSNVEIRNKLAIYYDFIASREQYSFINHDLQLQYLTKQEGILSGDQKIAMASFSFEEKYSPEEAFSVYQRFLKNDEFIALLPSIAQSKIRSLGRNQNFLERAKDLKALIDSELKK